MLSGCDDSRASRSPGPPTRNRPRLQVNVGEPVLRKPFLCPVIRLLELRRPGHPRPDAVGEIFEVRHRLAAIVDLTDDLGVGCREWTLLIRRRPGQTRANTNQSSHATEHEHTDST